MDIGDTQRKKAFPRRYMIMGIILRYLILYGCYSFISAFGSRSIPAIPRHSSVKPMLPAPFDVEPLA